MSEDNEPIDVGSEPVEETQMALVTTAEINQQIATAKKYPRDIKKFKTECTSLATLDEDVAGECFYRLERKGQDGKVSVIEGPSSRMAEIVASCWGNCRAAARIIDEGERFVVAQGAFLDLERNVAITYETRRRITTSKGKRYGDDMIAVTGNAACSIALRNAVFKGVPKAFWSGALEKAKATYRGTEASLVTKRDQWRAYWKKVGVPDDRVLAVLGKANWDSVDLDDCMRLRGIATSIKEGDNTIDQAFPIPQAAIDATKSKADQVADDLAKRKAEKELPLDEADKALPENKPTAEEVAKVEAGEPVNTDPTHGTTDTGSHQTEKAADGELSEMAATLKADLDKNVAGKGGKEGMPITGRFLKDIGALKADGKLSNSDHLTLYNHAFAIRQGFGKR